MTYFSNTLDYAIPIIIGLTFLMIAFVTSTNKGVKKFRSSCGKWLGTWRMRKSAQTQTTILAKPAANDPKDMEFMDGVKKFLLFALVLGLVELSLFILEGSAKTFMVDLYQHHFDQFMVLNALLLGMVILGSTKYSKWNYFVVPALSIGLIISAASTWPFFTGEILAPVGELSQLVEIPRGSRFDCRAVNPKEDDLFDQYYVNMQGETHKTVPGVPTVNGTAVRFKSISDHPIRIRCEDVRVR